MEQEQSPVNPSGQNPPPPSAGGGVKKALGPLAVLAAIVAKFKGFLILAIKFLPVILKSGGLMFVSLWVYAQFWGWYYAAGFILLIFVHECGHLLVAKYFKLKVSAPMFIPFLGALIMLKEMPRNAWMEALVGIGGPILGSAGAAVCFAIYYATGNPLYGALAYTGFFINLFNLAPFGFLDGGRIVTALSPWLWLVGAVIIGAMMFVQFNFILLFIFIMSLPRVFTLFRKRTDAEDRYFEVTPQQRWIVGTMYFGLIALLVVGMMASHIHPDRLNSHQDDLNSYQQT